MLGHRCVAAERLSDAPEARTPTSTTSTDSSNGSPLTSCVHGGFPLKERLSACHGYGNILSRINAERVECPGLERGASRGDGGLLLGGQADRIEDETRQIPQKGREAVRRETLPRELVGGLAPGTLGTSAASTGFLCWTLAAASQDPAQVVSRFHTASSICCALGSLVCFIQRSRSPWKLRLSLRNDCSWIRFCVSPGSFCKL